MECTVNVKKLPANIIDQLRENLDKLKLHRASNITACDNLDKEWRELFDSLVAQTLAAIAAIDKYNANQCKISQRIKRAVLRVPSNYKNIPFLLQEIAYNNNRGINMVRAGSMDYPFLRSYLAEFSSLNEFGAVYSPESVVTVDRMMALSDDHFRCNQAQENARLKIIQLEAIITAADIEYISIPDINLSTLETLINLKELSQ